METTTPTIAEQVISRDTLLEKVITHVAGSGLSDLSLRDLEDIIFYCVLGVVAGAGTAARIGSAVEQGGSARRIGRGGF